MTAIRNPLSTAAAGTIQVGDKSVNRIGFGAVELGVNLIDTSNTYGPNVAEEISAEALYPYPDNLVIATKGGLTRPDQSAPDGRPEHLREACEDCLCRLRLDCIELYQLHHPDPKAPFEESVGELARLRAEGKIRHVGLSNGSVAQLDSTCQIVPIIPAQNRYNRTERMAEAVLQVCESANIVFLPWSPLKLGDLAHSGGTLDPIAQAHDATARQVVLPIPGTSSVAHLEENVAAASLTFTDEETAALEG